MEQLGLLVLIVLFWLAQFFVRALRDRAAPRPAPEPTPPPARRPAPVPDDEALFARMPLPVPSPALPRPAPVAAHDREPRPSRRRSTALGTRQELRRAIVLRDVLGPCRALQAPEPGD